MIDFDTPPGASAPLARRARARLYWERAKAGFREHSTYRAAAVAGLVTNTVFGMLRAAIFLAVLDANGAPIEGFDRTAAVSYVWLGQGLIGVVAIWSWSDIADRIPTGEIARDLLRPADFQLWWLARDYGRALFNIGARGIPQYLIGMIGFAVVRPPIVRLATFAIAVILAVTISFGLRFIANLLVFWTMQWRGISVIYTSCILIFSGMELPLDLYPEVVERVLCALPWYGIVQAPIEIFLDRRPAPGVLAVQLAWAVAVLAIGRAVFAAATRRVVVQGG
jgi:ABC-2 type transport system permease protein